MSTARVTREAAADRFIFPITAASALDPDRVGPKAANLAALGRAGLPIPDSFCVDAQAYRRQLGTLDVDVSVRRVASATELMQARRQAIEVRLALLSRPIA